MRGREGTTPANCIDGRCPGSKELREEGAMEGISSGREGAVRGRSRGRKKQGKEGRCTGMKGKVR